MRPDVDAVPRFLSPRIADLGTEIQDVCVCVCRPFGEALHGVHNSKIPGHFGVRIEMALRQFECGVPAEMVRKMALHNTKLNLVDMKECPPGML